MNSRTFLRRILSSGFTAGLLLQLSIPTTISAETFNMKDRPRCAQTTELDRQALILEPTHWPKPGATVAAHQLKSEGAQRRFIDPELNVLSIFNAVYFAHSGKGDGDAKGDPDAVDPVLKHRV